jgi:hypothetical protein
VVACVALGASVALAAPSALADRAPTKSERAAIKRVAVKRCAAPPINCTFKRARVSTRNARYAWATVIGEGVSGVLVKRRTKHARRFKTIGVQGGGIQTCAYWRRRAPRRVLRDLHIRGLFEDTGETRSCG